MERLEEQMMPIGETIVLQIVGVDSAGNRTDGPRFVVQFPRTPPRTIVREERERRVEDDNTN